MKKVLLSLLAVTITTLSIAQTPEELNQKYKIFLDKQDFKNAVPIIKQAAEKGNAEAQYNYGFCYQQGIEVPKSDSIANIWFLKSANQGWKDAQFKLAYSFATGRGVKKDDEQSFFWSLKCAQQQDVECMFNVVGCYMDGSGTGKSIDSMLTWASRIALLENVEDLSVSGQITSARANLGAIYKAGEIVPKNLLSSYTWYLLYNESKRDFSVLVQQQNIEIIKELEKELSLADRTKAKGEAERLWKRKLTNIDNLHKQDL